MQEPLLSLCVDAGYPGRPNILRGVSLEMGCGEILGLVGQSGCGKSTLALAILRLLPWKRGQVDGWIRLGGRDLLGLRESEMRSIRGREISLVLQSPLSALNPALRIGDQLTEAWRAHSESFQREECLRAIFRSLADVSLPVDAELLRRYPAQLSVGQAQRVLIAMAILHRPALLIADEPTSALDVVTQSEILRLFSRLSRKFNMGILLISHDLLSIAAISHRVAVMDQGEIVECRPAAELFRKPAHPFTRTLIAAVPVAPRMGAGLGDEAESADDIAGARWPACRSTAAD